MNLSDMPNDERIFGLAKGKPGAGKSIGLSSFPKPMYIFDFDGRSRAIKRWWEMKDPKEMVGIEADIYTANDFSKFQAKGDEMMGNPKKYATVIADSLTTCVDMILQYSKGLRGVDTTRDKKRRIGTIQLLEIEDYNAETMALGDMMEFFRRLPCHFWLTAHELHVVEKNILTNTIHESRTLMTAGKKIGAKMPVYFDEIWHFGQEPSMNVLDPPQYVISTAQVGEAYAKTSLGLPTSINWTNKNLFQEINRLRRDKRGATVVPAVGNPVNPSVS